MSGRRIAPMSERLFNSPGQGGPQPKHLHTMLRILCKRFNRDMPDIGAKDGYALAKYLQKEFASSAIDWAHDEARKYYASLKNNGDHASGTREFRQLPPPNTCSSNDVLDLEADRVPTTSNQGQQSSNNSDDDNKYVHRSDYDVDLKKTASLFYDIENKLNHISRFESNIHSDVIDLRNRVTDIQNKTPTVIEVKDHKTSETQFSGIVHKQFPLLAKAAGARLSDGTRLNFWLYGPAGTGKTHAAKTLAQSLFGGRHTLMTAEMLKEFQENYKRDWTDYNYSPTLSTAFQVMGYMDANGRYVPTPFFLTWKYGGVFLLDEIDGSMQDALLGLNGALSSTYASFPCGVVERHKDCIIIAGANTTGHGGDIEYLGTMKQNVAFLDRWVFIDWPHDDALESSLVSNSHWVQRVRNVRAKLAKAKIKGHVITMRASMQGAALLEAGIPFEQVEQMVLRKGIPQGQWDMVK